MRTVSGEGAAAVWREDGRPLTAWEQRMRETRVDLWLPINGSVYRLALGHQQLTELEQSTDSGIGKLWGGLNHVDGPDDGARSPAEHYVAAIRLALTGGAMGVASGRAFRVSPTHATQIADGLATGPLAVVVRIVRALIAVCGRGRPATADEIAAFSIPAGPPLIPAWALEYQP
jgi:hypothetical protein